MKRRTFATLLAASGVSAALLAPKNSWGKSGAATMTEALKQLEIDAQGRLGVHILNTATGQEFGHRSDEQFMMLSSFKLLASALVLARVDRGEDSLDRRIPYRKQDLIAWSPITEAHADGKGLTLAQLCHATITTSDNTAANLILDSYGGPKALTAFARRIGDKVTRLDRREPELNVPASPTMLDSTSPRAMAYSMKTLLTGQVLSVESRALLKQWLLANTTGGRRLKAGLPAGWSIGDKTGTNKTDANDIGVLYPPEGAPVFVTAYLASSSASSQMKDETLAAVGKLAATGSR